LLSPTSILLQSSPVTEFWLSPPPTPDFGVDDTLEGPDQTKVNMFPELYRLGVSKDVITNNPTETNHEEDYLATEALVRTSPSWVDKEDYTQHHSHGDYLVSDSLT
jgi:hypothetical protein